MDEQAQSEFEEQPKVVSDYDTIFNALNIGVFIYQTNKRDMRFLKVNEYGCELFNFKDEAAFIQHDWTLPQVCHPDEVDYLLSEMDYLNKVDDLVEHEYRLNRRNGTYVWVLCHQRVMGKQGEWLTILNSCTVIDEKKWAEEANAAKSSFLSNMSHDMRTPLNAIINIAALARDNVDKTDQMLSDLGEIELAGNYLLSLVNDALDMNRIENRAMQFVPSAYPWQEFVDYVDSIIVPLCRDKNIEFIWDKQGADKAIWVDKTRLNQVFFNILSNAAKYTNPGGSVTLRAMGKPTNDDMLVCDFEIIDTGIGMSKGFQKRMFEPFEREERASAYGGTGLGLPIAKEIIEAMQGSIQVESQQGRGTKVLIHLVVPLVSDNPDKTGISDTADTKTDASGANVLEETVQTYHNVNGTHLLIVEDNLTNREIILRLVRKRGYSADWVVNGKEALDAIASCKPWYYQAILMDIRMPIMDGLTATRCIRRLESDYAQTIPIIAMTADAYASDTQASLAAGMNAHLAKPVNPAMLFKTLDELVSETKQSEVCKAE